MKNRMFLIVTTLVIVAGSFILATRKFQTSENARLDFISTHNSEQFVRPYSPVKGAVSATIFVTEFLDPECESCRAMYPHVKQLLQEYDGKIKVVIRYIPFHRNSEFAIRILEASRAQNKYWEVLEMMFESQAYWADHHTPKPELLWEYLPTQGVDIEKLKADMNSLEIQNIIDTDKADANQLGVRGTPTFFVNGKLVDQHGPEYLKQAIEAVLKN